MKLRTAIAQWILVRTFGYAVQLLWRLDHDCAHPQFVNMVRGVVIALDHQIQQLSYPAFRSESPTTKRFNNQWP